MAMLENRKKRVLNCAMGGNIHNGDFLRPICKLLDLDYVTMSEWSDHDIRWQKDSWLSELAKADIVVCPQNVKTQPSKSNNRATQAMSLGKPVLASPLLSYKEAIEDGVTGFLCGTPEEWEKALRRLKDDPDLIHSMGERAREAVREKYSIGEIAGQWKGILKNLAFENCAPPKVDIVVATWNNLKYLKICVESIRKNTDWPHNLIVVSSGTDQTADWLKDQPDVIRAVSPVRLHFSAANNVGITLAKEKYVCLLNDDTIVGQGWLGAMMHEAMKPHIGAVGPFSNCDRAWLHDEVIRVEGIDLVPSMNLDHVEKIIPAIGKYRHRKVVIDRKWLAFYAILMKREAVTEVGLLDENFKSGGEDMDYCVRLREKGWRIVSTWDSWVYHFGGKTRKNSEDQNYALHHEEDRKNNEYFEQKWGKSPGAPEFKNMIEAKAYGDVKAERIPLAAVRPGERRLFGIYTGQAWERWCPKNLDEGGIGGSETATVHTARAFRRRGWQAVVFGDCQGMEGEYDGVEYVHYDKFEEWVRTREFDLFVSSRRADVMIHPIRAKHKAVVVHDIWLSQDPNADLHVDRVDKFFVLSPWHKQFFMNHHKQVPESKIHVTRDGVDLERFQNKLSREKGRLIYSSSPDRGLDVLFDVFQRIKKAVPQASLHVFYGFNNWEKMIRTRGRPGEVQWMEAIKNRLDDPGVVYRGRIGQTQLAKEILRSELWAYPTHFCVAGDTLIDCPRDFLKHPDGIPISQVKEGQLVWTINEETQLFELKRVKWAKKTKLGQRLFKLTLDTGKTIRATPDHRFMRRDGSWAELKDLRTGDSLMALHRDFEPLVKVDPNAQAGWAQEYRVLGKTKWSQDELRGKHVHHWDERHANSSEENLAVVTPSQNFSYSRKGRGIKSSHQRKRMSDAQKNFFLTAPPEILEKRIAHVRENAGKMWKDLTPEERKRKWHKIHPAGTKSELRAVNGVMPRGSEASKAVKRERWRVVHEIWRQLYPSYPIPDRQVPRTVDDAQRMSVVRQKVALAIQSFKRELIAKDAFYNHKVVSVVEDKSEDVWDMEVEGNHNFISHGIVLHNCETFCMSSAEMMAAGTPIVACDLAALHTTVGETGILISGDCRSREFQDKFVDECIRMLTDKVLWEEYSRRGLERAKAYSWDTIADEWLEIFEGARKEEPALS
jgi:GT2 family glycosyltransferase